MADHFADFRSKKINFPSASFDAAYAIEATVHAPSLEAVYSQIFRVLKPGGVFGVYEWVMTDAYDESNEHHRKIRLGIERGNGIANMVPRKEALEAMKKAGFVVEHEEDLAQRKVSPIADRRPWYAPLAGDLAVAQTLGDFFGVLRMSSIGRMGVGVLLRTMETLRLAPLGSAETAAELSAGADALVAGGKEGLFTPMYLMVARKPVPGDV
jgi:sterol 24-C-methyltransferase